MMQTLNEMRGDWGVANSTEDMTFVSPLNMFKTKTGKNVRLVYKSNRSENIHGGVVRLVQEGKHIH